MIGYQRERVAAALPGYELGAELGRGAWGVVLAAEHRALHRQVAVKILSLGVAGDPAVQQRFGIEAQVLAALDHPHIVRIFDYVEHGDLCLFVMDLLAGGTLRDLMGSRGVSAEQACSLALAATTALHHAHRSGVLHRDVKPENLMFGSTGILRVTDFGIAKVLSSSAAVTRAGEVFGTAAYIAPEQVMGGELTAATDVYGLGTVLYEMLAGRLPFAMDDNAMAVLYRHVHEAPARLTDVAPWVPGEVAAVVMQAIATDPAARTADAEELGVALADAALEAWGGGWVGRTGVEVVTSGRIAAHISSTPRRPAIAVSADAVAADTAAPLAAAVRRRRIGAALADRVSRRMLVAAALAVAVIAAVVVVAGRHGKDNGLAVTPPASAAAASAVASSGTSAGPAGGRGRLVFADETMTDPTSGWAPDPNQGDNGSVAFRADGYHVTALKPNAAPLTTYSVASPFALRLTSLGVEVDAVITGSPPDGAGVRCDQGGGRAGLRYTFEVHGDGSWMIFRIDTAGSLALAQGSSPAVHPDGVRNTIGGECDDLPSGGQTRLTMTVNGTVMGSAVDHHPGAAISWHSGLVVYRDPASPATDVRFTAFHVRDGSG